MTFKDIPIEKPELRELGKLLGVARIRAIIGRFYAQMAKDILIGFFFDGRDLQKIADGQSAFLYRAMGLTPGYTGKSPADAHTHLPPILSGHFDRRLKILEEVLTSEGLTEKQRLVWIGFENAFRAAIVTN